MTADSSQSIALVGAGRWGRHILRDLVALGATVHVVAGSEQSVENAREFGAASIVSAIADLPGVDAAVAAPITTAHAEVIDELAATVEGPIYVEKPMTADLESADRLAASLGDRLFVMDKWRYHAGILELARIAKSGELGELRSVQTRRVATGSPHQDVDTLWIHAPHDLSICLEILGEIPELVHANGEYIGDELVGANATFGRDPWLQIEVSNEAPAHRRETRIVCDGGSAVLDGGWAEQITVRQAGGETEQRQTPGELPLLAELRAFLGHVAGGPPPKSSAAEGALIVRRITEIHEFAAAGRSAAVS